MIRPPPRSTLFPYHDALPICPGGVEVLEVGLGELARGAELVAQAAERDGSLGLADADDQGLHAVERVGVRPQVAADADGEDRKSTRLNSSHANISYAVFCLKK